MKPSLSVMAAHVLVLAAMPSFAFQLAPTGTRAEREMAKRWGTTIKAEVYFAGRVLHKLSDPVHETMSQLTYDCGPDWSSCADPDLEHAGPYVIAGVRWNDDPTFQLSAGEGRWLRCRTGDTVSVVTQTACWVGLFKDAEAKARKDPTYFLRAGNGNYMSRSHFGDLQFLHAMANQDGVPATETRRKILMWMEFAWKVALGEFKLGTPLRSISLEGWGQHFANGQNVQDLLTLSRPWLRPHIQEVAFGSMLHVVQDSFSAAHVERREPVSGMTCAMGQRQAGRIIRFLSYAQQDHSKHKEKDSPESAQRHLARDTPDAVDAGRALRDFLDRKVSWESVQQYLIDCVFPLDDDSLPSGPGAEFQ